ncbi:MAG: hypothetical protein WC728_03820 [Elusimicrobiota bacterium]
MAEETFKLKKLHPPFGTAESPLWEFGYDEEVRVVGGLCEVRSPGLRDRLLKMGYEPATEDTPPPAAPKGKWKPKQAAKPGSGARPQGGKDAG